MNKVKTTNFLKLDKICRTNFFQKLLPTIKICKNIHTQPKKKTNTSNCRQICRPVTRAHRFFSFRPSFIPPISTGTPGCAYITCYACRRTSRTLYRSRGTTSAADKATGTARIGWGTSGTPIVSCSCRPACSRTGAGRSRPLRRGHSGNRRTAHTLCKLSYWSWNAGSRARTRTSPWDSCLRCTVRCSACRLGGREGKKSSIRMLQIEIWLFVAKGGQYVAGQKKSLVKGHTTIKCLLFQIISKLKINY